LLDLTFKKSTIKKKPQHEKLSFLLTLVLGLCLSFNAKSQTNDEYFPGKWKVSIFGTPQGDVTMIFVIEKKDGKFTGVVQDTTGVEISKISNVEEAAKTITVFFNAAGYDLNLPFEPVDADNVKGSLMGMFDAKGTRVKEPKSNNNYEHK